MTPSRGKTQLQMTMGWSLVRSMMPSPQNYWNGLVGSRSCATAERKVLPGGLQRFSLATWNSNGLLGKEAAKSRKKTKYLKNLLRTYDAVAVQELHGDEMACKRLANDYRHSHLLNFSPGPSLAIGGIAFFTKRSITDRFTAPPALDLFEAGRTGTLTLAFEDGDIFINNVHHFDLKDEHAVVGRVTDYNRRALSNTSGRSVSFVAGDFNFLP